MKFTIFAVGLSMGMVIGLAGCSQNAPAPSAAAQKQSTQQAIRSVQDNPNIPPDQKASIVAHFQNPAGPPNMPRPAN